MSILKRTKNVLLNHLSKDLSSFEFFSSVVDITQILPVYKSQSVLIFSIKSIYCKSGCSLLAG